MPRRDDHPMLSMHANAAELKGRFGHVPARKKGEPKPWHYGLAEFWKFMRRREQIVLMREAGAAFARGMRKGDHSEGEEHAA